MKFPGVKSLKQVFGALLLSLNNAEINISERLGHLTVRDDYDCVDGNIVNARILSTNDIGATIEVNSVMFAQFFGAEDGGFDETPCGIVVLDSVDEDELYPYEPSERIRKDISGAFVLTVDRRKAASVPSSSSGVDSSESSDDESWL